MHSRATGNPLFKIYTNHVKFTTIYACWKPSENNGQVAMIYAPFHQRYKNSNMHGQFIHSSVSPNNMCNNKKMAIYKKLNKAHKVAIVVRW